MNFLMHYFTLFLKNCSVSTTKRSIHKFLENINLEYYLVLQKKWLTYHLPRGISISCCLASSAVEGTEISFNIRREEGIYGEVDVLWEILDSTTREIITNGTDFVENSGNVTFGDLDVLLPLTLIPLADGIPEYQEDFIIRLTNVTGTL